MDSDRLFLLVDDLEEMTMLLAHLLAPYGECVTAANGAEAIDTFKKYMAEGRRFDAVFMDILMPEMDGHETAGKLRDIEVESGVPPTDCFKLVMITALSDTKNVCKSFFKDGLADAYICKPIRREQLIAELKNIQVVS